MKTIIIKKSDYIFFLIGLHHSISSIERLKYPKTINYHKFLQKKNQE